ncbi:MAG: trypsin-like peptidase domain-containing protein [Deltaproteobacteria bacterium]|nr:trypsin-like peptidase domain-containing protein [Deltaproteobacteria bacterium]
MRCFEAVRGMGLVAAVAGLALGCGPDATGTPTTPTATGAPSASAAAEEATIHELPTGKTRVGSEKLLDRRHRLGLAADTLDQVKTNSGPPKTATEIYKAAAPATVIIRVGGGLGSGIIIDPAGWVLTNHHVIAAGKAEDFKYKAGVLLGKLSKDTGAMERTDKEYEAEVYKADKLRDLALLKIIDPPKNLPAVKIATVKPAPGNSVVALGHAGAGMLWALKSGQISAMGKLSEALAQLASFKDDEEGRKARKAFKKYIDSKNLGMVIQSTCSILPGDSGGPLLNARGELIGLNVFTNSDRKTGGLLSFHVHLNEVQKFAKNKPKRPRQLLPDPWLEGGGDLSYEDADLDGRVDVLLMQGRKPCTFCPRQSTAVFFDTDQNSFTGRSKLPDLNDVFDKRDFDAEAVYLQLERNVLIWYDTDNDGKFDILLYDEGTRGITKAGYRIGKDGTLSRDDTWTGEKPFRPALFSDPGLHERFARISRAAFPARYTDAPGPMGSTLPDPIGKFGSAQTGDLNRDGRPDAIDVTSPFSKRLLLDADQSFVPGLPMRFQMAKADRKSFDPEVAIVSQATQMWVFYDTDDDSLFDLALHSPGARVYVAGSAWRLDASGGTTAAPEHIGRKLIRPDLLTTPKHAEGARSMVQRGILAIMSAQDGDGLSSFPHPVKDHRGTGMQLLDIKAAPKTVVAIVGRGSDGYLLDLDRSSGLFGPRDKIDITKRVKDDRFDAEFAYFQRNGIAWTFYDTDMRPGYDLVLVSLKPASGKVAAAYSVATDGTVKYDAGLESGALVRPAVFKSPLLKARMKTLATELFADAMVAK